MDSKQKRENREMRRKREMAELKENLLKRFQPGASGQKNGDGGIDGEVMTEEEPRKYIDRSAMRRNMHPSSPPPSRTATHSASQSGHRRSTSPISRRQTPVSAVPTPPPAALSSFASGMLAKSGWIPGVGLGKDATGRAEPISVELRNEKRGLGAVNSKSAAETVQSQAAGDWRERGKQRRWEDFNRS